MEEIIKAHIADIEKTVKNRGSAIVMRGPLLLTLHQLLEFYKEPTKKPTPTKKADK